MDDHTAPPEGLLIAAYNSLRLDTREFRVQEQRALQGMIRLVVLVYAAGFLVALPGDTSDTPLSALPGDAFALVFATGVPGIIMTGMLVWLDTVLGRQFAMNRLDNLTRQFPHIPWPESVAAARRAGNFPAPRAMHSTVGGLIVLPAAASGSIILALLRLRDAGLTFSWLMTLAFVLGGAATIGVTTYTAVRIWQLRYTSPNFRDDSDHPADHGEELPRRDSHGLSGSS